MNDRILILALFFSLFINYNWGQSQPASEKIVIPTFSTLDTRNGLSQNSISHIKQDSEGLMWFATQVNIDCYNGYTIRSVKGLKKGLGDEFSFLENYDKERMITGIGQSIYLIDKTRLKATFKAKLELTGKIFAFYKVALPNSQTVYVFFTDQKVYITDEQFKTRTSESFTGKAISVEQVSALKFIVGTSEQILHTITLHGAINSDDLSLHLASFPKTKFPIHSLHFNKAHNFLFVGSDSINVHYYHLNNGQLHYKDIIPPTHKEEHVTPSEVKSLYYDHNHQLWVGTQFSGVHLVATTIDSTGTTFSYEASSCCHLGCREHPALTSDKILTINASRDQVIWIGTEAGGINYWQEFNQQTKYYFGGEYTIRTQGTERDSIVSYNNHALGLFAYSDNELLVGSEDGLTLLDLESKLPKKRILSNVDNPESKIVFNIIPTNSDSIILSTEDGLYFFKKSALKTKAHYLKYSKITDKPKANKFTSILYHDKKKGRWFLSSRGKSSIYILDNNFDSIATTLRFPEEEKISFVQGLNNESGNTLIATTTSLYLYDGKQVSKKLNQIGVHITCAIEDAEDKNQLWLGTDRAGIYKYDLQKQVLIDSIKEKDGLPSDVTYTILLDTHRNIWISTNHGIYQICPVNKLINHYAQSNGLTGSVEFNSGSFCLSKDKRSFFMGSTNGVYYIEPKNIPSKDFNYTSQLMFTLSYPKINEHPYRRIFPKNDSTKTNTVIHLGKIPNQFNYLDLSFSLSDYHNSTNNQFKVTLNGKDSVYAENGIVRFSQNDLNWGAGKFLVGCNNEIKIAYRASNGNWIDDITIRVKRGNFPYYIWIIVAGVGILFGYFMIRQRSLQRLSQIQTRINEVSKHRSIDKLISTVKNYLIQEYDYVIFSFVDFETRRIQSVDETHKAHIPDPNDWLANSDYPLDDVDILAQIVRTGTSVIVVRNQIFGDKITNKDQALNKKILEANDHDNLGRLFVPIKARLANDEVIVMGVIEAGYELQSYEYPTLFGKWLLRIFPGFGLNIHPREYLKRELISLELYLDNFAQPYYAAKLKQQRKELYKKVVDNSEKEYPDHFEFIEVVLQRSAKAFGVDYGNVGFRTYNNSVLDLTDRVIFYNQKKEDIYLGRTKYDKENKGKISLVQHVIDTKKPYIANDVSTDPYYYKYVEDIQSEIALPIKDKFNVIYGVYVLSSRHKNFFNSFISSSLRKVIDKATAAFLKKKEANTASQLMTPFDVFSQDTVSIYENAVEALKDYFYCDYISVWEKESNFHDEKEKTEGKKFILSEATIAPFYDKYKDFYFLEKRINQQNLETDSESIIQVIQVEDYENQDASIIQFCKKEQFKSYIVLVISIEDKIEGFINIFSKRKLEKDEVSLYDKQFLTRFIEKLSIALQNTKLVGSIETLSKSLSSVNTKDTLQVIVDQAYNLMPSTDSVVLFPYRGHEIKVKDLYSAGNLPEGDIKKQDKRANLANYVIEHGTQWIMSKEENVKIVEATKPEKPERPNFWDMRGVKSVAAIRLVYESAENKKSLGVMFFNYNKEKDFYNPEFTRIINAFTNLASIALRNEEFIQRVQTETEKLDATLKDVKINRAQLEKDKLELEKENDKLSKTMEEMLPRATRTSYFLILQGVNHDIRNFLLGMQYELKEISLHASQKDKEIIEKHYNHIDANVKNINNLLKLFDFREEKEKEFIKVSYVINQVIHFFKNRDKLVNFQVSYQDDVPSLLCLKTEFSMIIYNIINNAIQAMDHKGTINIALKFSMKYYSISIEDNGPGVDKKLHDELFKFGYTTKEDGLGIGLFFVKETIEKSFKGEIRVDSSKGKGSTFIIKIPAYINYQ